MKRRIPALFCLLSAVLVLLALASCAGGDDPAPGFPKHTITVESTGECGVSVDKTQAEFAETVTVTLDLRVSDKYVDRVTYNGQSANKRSENTYDFLMGNDDVTVAVELKPYVPQLSDPGGFASLPSSEPTTLAKGNGEVELSVSLRASFMSVLYWDIRSTNQAVLPGASTLKAGAEQTDTGAISAGVQTAGQSNAIVALNLLIDTDRLGVGTTYLLIDLVNGNTSSQRASLVIPITVADEIATTKWTETLLFDVSALPAAVRQGELRVYVTDYDYVPGSDNREYQTFENLRADADDKVEVPIEYVPGHRYFVALCSFSGGSLTGYRLADTVLSGSSSTGYNQLKDNLLTLLSDGQTFTIRVLDEMTMR